MEASGLTENELLAFAELLGEGDSNIDDTVNTLPSGEELQLTAVEQKRQRARERERRKYYRKKGRLTDLLRQVTTLERQLEELSSHRSTIHSTEGNGPSRTAKDLKTQLIEVKNTKSQLRSENTQLRRQFREASQRAALLYDLLRAEQKLYHVHESHFRLLTPLSHDAHRAIHRSAIHRINTFDTTILEAYKVGAVAGWRGTRFIDGGLFKFALEKTYKVMNAEAVWHRLWTLMTDPDQLRRTFPPAMDMRIRLVQKFDDDNYVFLEEMRSVDPADKGAPVKSAILISRHRVGSSYRIYLQNLDRWQIEMVDNTSGDPVELTREMWLSSDQLVWMEQRDTGFGVHQTKFCGMMPTIGAHLYFWMAEIVMVTLRTEVEVLGHRFSVVSD